MDSTILASDSLKHAYIRRIIGLVSQSFVVLEEKGFGAGSKVWSTNSFDVG